MVENRLTQQYFQLVQINTFVEECFAMAQEKEVLAYMYVHFQKLAAAEKELHFSHNVALWRVYVLNQEFVDRRCILPEEMWRVGLSKTNSEGAGAGKDENGNSKS